MDFPIKVLILDTVMDRGGSEATTMNYFRNMDRSRVTYDFLVHREYRAEYENEIESLGGTIHRIYRPTPQNYFKYRKAVRKLFLEHPEYRIIHSNMMELGLFTYMQAKKCGLPVRICHAHTAPINAKITPKTLMRAVYKTQINKYLTHRFACGKAAAKWVFGEQYEKDVVFVRNAIDAEKYKYNPEIEAELRQEFNLEGKFVVGHVGRFFEPKNHPFIIEIFAEIAKKDDDAVLMLVGGGETDDAVLNQTKEKVKELGLEKRVIFTGVRSDVNRLIQCFDVFILPSLQEGFPVVMVEAQAAGLKCIISDKVSPECDITNTVDILTLESGAEIWAERILSYKNSYEKKDMYQAIVDARFDIKENAKWLEEYYIKELEKAER